MEFLSILDRIGFLWDPLPFDFSLRRSFDPALKIVAPEPMMLILNYANVSQIDNVYYESSILKEILSLIPFFF